MDTLWHRTISGSALNKRGLYTPLFYSCNTISVVPLRAIPYKIHLSLFELSLPVPVFVFPTLPLYFDCSLIHNFRWSHPVVLFLFCSALLCRNVINGHYFRSTNSYKVCDDIHGMEIQSRPWLQLLSNCQFHSWQRHCGGTGGTANAPCHASLAPQPRSSCVTGYIALDTLVRTYLLSDEHPPSQRIQGTLVAPADRDYYYYY